MFLEDLGHYLSLCTGVGSHSWPGLTLEHVLPHGKWCGMASACPPPHSPSSQAVLGTHQWEATAVVRHVPTLGPLLMLILLPELVLLTPALLSRIPLVLGSPALIV